MYRKKLVKYIYPSVAAVSIILASQSMEISASEPNSNTEDIEETEEIEETEPAAESENDLLLDAINELDGVIEIEDINTEDLSEQEQKEIQEEQNSHGQEIDNDDQNYQDSDSEEEAEEEKEKIAVQVPFVLQDNIQQSLSQFFSDKIIVKVSAGSSLNMRKEPNTEAEILYKLKAGEMADLAEEASEAEEKSALEKSCSDDGEWIKIRYRGKVGYISAKYALVELEAQSIAIAGEKMTAIVKWDEDNNSESEEPFIVTSIADDQVTVMNNEGEEETYAYDLLDYEVEPIEAEYLAEYTKKAETFFWGTLIATGERRDMIDFALQFVGNPYVWGGISLTDGADCSGFVQAVMGQFGIGTPRVASDQYAASKKVKGEDLKPGDLVFYTDGTEISHVAMYIGAGQIVHARNSAMGIRVDSVNYGVGIAGYGTYLN